MRLVFRFISRIDGLNRRFGYILLHGVHECERQMIYNGLYLYATSARKDVYGTAT